ncbi:MAG: N-acetylneuraminate synthase family protein, partial [Odoribacter sp.]
LGATVVEKHFIIDRSIGGPDCEFSMNKEEFALMVRSIRNVEKALGKVDYPMDPAKVKGRAFCRSLYVAENMKKNDIVTTQNVRSVRPGYGLHPKHLNECLGRHVKCDLEKGTPFNLDFLEK